MSGRGISVPPKVITLVGQMGAGKSTVAVALAAALPAGLNACAVDLDAEIEREAGQPVADIFATLGEPAFRALERRLLAVHLTPGDGIRVLATGGGAVCHEAAIAAALEAGPVIWLDAAPSVLAARAAGPGRPLLAGRSVAEAEAFLAAQRAAREPFYARAHLRLDAARPVPELVGEIVARYFGPMSSVPQPDVHPIDLVEVALPAPVSGHAYPIRFVPGPPGDAALDAILTHLPGARRVLVVTDTNVAALHADPFVRALEARPGLSRVALHVVPAGEASKSLASVGAVCDAALEAGITRRDALVALGGGVVGDLTGFAAAMLHRGVAFVQVPTTLLAQVDSAVGGKTGVNHAAGKNLLGAFWQPAAVVASQSVLATLPEREWRCGLAEAVKHGAIADADLFAWIDAESAAILAREPAVVARLVRRCCEIKRDVVVRDPTETGERALLNFGHTLGHAYERLLGYGHLTHGEAVALGMILAARVSERLGGGALAGTLEAPIEQLLARLGFETDVLAPSLPDFDALVAAAAHDKKADASGTVRFITLTRLGEAAVTPLSFVDVRRLLAEGAP